MKNAGRVSAAIEVLHEVMTRHIPAADALRDWGKAHRFAGSSDRHSIGTLVYDSLRQRNSAGLQGGGEAARNIVMGVLRGTWGWPIADIAALCAEQHGPTALTVDERTALTSISSSQVPFIAGNFPDWLLPDLTQLFGKNTVAEGQALSQRAPIDLRVNTLKTTREQVLDALQRFGAIAGPLLPTSVRLASPGPEQKHINVEVEPAHGMGWFEVQDTASQIAAALSGVQPGEQVADICAGAGGKTLALAALMKNQGRLVAHDVDRHRLRPIFERALRSGASCIEVVAAEQASTMLEKSFDCVVVDAPCSGTGAWRRKPETKWKLTRSTLEQRMRDQQSVLARGAALVKIGGRLVYITCSILPCENTVQVKQFLAENKEFKVLPYGQQWARAIGGKAPASADGSNETLLLTPHQHNVDGFFVAVMQRQ
jgi:16S rRNA (cytosine967-C5)-methyltransferase